MPVRFLIRPSLASLVLPISSYFSGQITEAEKSRRKRLFQVNKELTI
jgi:hypothetical protein